MSNRIIFSQIKQIENKCKYDKWKQKNSKFKKTRMTTLIKADRSNQKEGQMNNDSCVRTLIF